MNFTRHLVVVIALVVFFLLIIGFWATSVATTESNNAANVQASFGIPKDSYGVVSASETDASRERKDFISEIRAALRSQPEPEPKPEVVVEKKVVPYTPPVAQTAPVIIPVPQAEPEKTPEPIDISVATTTPELQGEVPLSVQ